MSTSLYPSAKRIVVAIDPAVSSLPGSDETGIVVVALGLDTYGYVLDDLSGRLSPERWAQRAIDAYWQLQADRIIGEVNNGGDMVESTLRAIDRNVSFKAVHASRGKQTRAEPIVALYEKHRIFHVQAFPELEEEMCSWEPGQDSPSRMDALVWGFTELFFGTGKAKMALLGGR